MKYKCRYGLCALVVAALALPVHAAPVCPPSAKLAPFDYPGARVIPTSNNLLLPAGKSIPAEGQAFLLRGRVLDRECKPVAEAMVELWQVGPFGRWMVANAEDLATPRPVFAGAGRTYTDSDGYFTFITAFPAPQRYDTPNINLRIKPEGMAEYKSAFFFAEDERNRLDKTFEKLAPAEKRDLSIVVTPVTQHDGMLSGEVTIALPENAPYRTY